MIRANLSAFGPIVIWPAALKSCRASKRKVWTMFLHQQGIDTSTIAGMVMFQMLSVFAEFERGIIRERVNAGLARAR